MDISKFLKYFGSKDIAAKENLLKVLSIHSILYFIVEGLFARDERVQLECAGFLRFVSKSAPRILYPYLNSLIDLLRQPNPILNADARFMLTQIKRIDTQKKLEGFNPAGLAEHLFGAAVRPI